MGKYGDGTSVHETNGIPCQTNQNLPCVICLNKKCKKLLENLKIKFKNEEN
jgi:hypothetical protein